MENYYSKAELKKVLEKRKVDKELFDFVFQFVNRNCEYPHKYCIGCVEDTLTIIEEVRREREPTLKQVKEVICPNCKLFGHCAEDVKCNYIEALEKLFRADLR
jgi:hypothetical protein